MSYNHEQRQLGVILFSSNLASDPKETELFKKRFDMRKPFEDEDTKSDILYYNCPSYNGFDGFFLKSEQKFDIRVEMIDGKIKLFLQDNMQSALEFANSIIKSATEDDTLHHVDHLVDVYNLFGYIPDDIPVAFVEETAESLSTHLAKYGDMARFVASLHHQPFSDLLSAYIEEEGDYYISLRYLSLDESDGYDGDQWNPWTAKKYLKLYHLTWYIDPWYSGKPKLERLLEVYNILANSSEEDMRHLRFILTQIKEWATLKNVELDLYNF